MGRITGRERQAGGRGDEGFTVRYLVSAEGDPLGAKRAGRAGPREPRRRAAQSGKAACNACNSIGCLDSYQNISKCFDVDFAVIHMILPASSGLPQPLVAFRSWDNRELTPFALPPLPSHVPVKYSAPARLELQHAHPRYRIFAGLA